MSESTSTSARQNLSRRQAIRILAGGVTALTLGACTPARIVLKAYPEEYSAGSDATEAALLAFIDTVVPGLTPEERRSVTVLQDPFYPLAKYCDFLASDLDRRARRQLPIDIQHVDPRPAHRRGRQRHLVPRPDHPEALHRCRVPGPGSSLCRDPRRSGRIPAHRLPRRLHLDRRTRRRESRATQRFASWATSADGNPA